MAVEPVRRERRISNDGNECAKAEAGRDGAALTAIQRRRMEKDKLRPVVYQVLEQIPGQRKWRHGEEQSGWFHEWRKEYPNRVLGIVERLDGTIVLVEYKVLRFTDREEGRTKDSRGNGTYSDVRL